MLYAKLCGMQTLAAARAAEAAGADYVGFVFWKKARRYLAPETAREIASQLRRAKKVGVFVDAPAEEVERIAALVGLDYVQLHGSEDAAYAKRLNYPVIKAFRYDDSFSAAAVDAFPAAFVLVDAYRAGVPGGTGQAFDWRRAAEEVRSIQKKVFIAGGLTAENVAAAADIFRPYAVDVSGGLEVAGEKDAGRIAAFMAAVRRVNAR